MNSRTSGVQATATIAQDLANAREKHLSANNVFERKLPEESSRLGLEWMRFGLSGGRGGQ
jgi:hypothetical protein